MCLITTIHVSFHSHFHVLFLNFLAMLGTEPRSLHVRQEFYHWDILPAPTLLFLLYNRIGYVEFCIVAWNNKKYTFWSLSLILTQSSLKFVISRVVGMIGISFFCSNIWSLFLVPNTKLLNMLGYRSVFCINIAACGRCIDTFKTGLVAWNNKHWLETLALLVPREGRGTGDWV